jgi:protein-tyrosine phosphatase
MKTRILFVCLGNIIRSPLAASLFEHAAHQAGVGEKYEVDSAGTGGWHAGEGPDPRMLRTASQRGFEYSHQARKIKPADLDSFDLIIAMDLENQADIEALARKASQLAKVHLLREFDAQADGDIAVPDPWYGGPTGFEDTYDIIQRSVAALLDSLQAGRLQT